MVGQKEINSSGYRPIAQWNPWFFVPFIIWVVAGGISLMCFSQKDLFAFFNTNNTAILDTLMPWITRMGEWLFIALLSLTPLLFVRTRNKDYAWMMVMVPLVVNLFNRVLKLLINEPRPLSVYGAENWVHHLDSWRFLYHYSFPSGHSAACFSVFTLVAMVLPKAKNIWGLHFFILAGLVGYSRMYLAAHFFADVYAGSIIGTVLTFATVYFIEKRRKQRAI